MLQHEHPRHSNSLELHEMRFPSKLGKSLNLLKLTSTRLELKQV